ncbi:hypothetical protein ACFSQT_27085 [Mesorhizobium calcicola]|uniref:Uncharacterized protein n=1 Tax=Mesorhizobium calcicola TaxID=1300310 RepID=A0ABW4WM29_9HYPH
MHIAMHPSSKTHTTEVRQGRDTLFSTGLLDIGRSAYGQRSVAFLTFGDHDPRRMSATALFLDQCDDGLAQDSAASPPDCFAYACDITAPTYAASSSTWLDASDLKVSASDT